MSINYWSLLYNPAEATQDLYNEVMQEQAEADTKVEKEKLRAEQLRAERQKLARRNAGAPTQLHSSGSSSSSTQPSPSSVDMGASTSTPDYTPILVGGAIGLVALLLIMRTNK